METLRKFDGCILYLLILGLMMPLSIACSGRKCGYYNESVFLELRAKDRHSAEARFSSKFKDCRGRFTGTIIADTYILAPLPVGREVLLLAHYDSRDAYAVGQSVVSLVPSQMIKKDDQLFVSFEGTMVNLTFSDDIPIIEFGDVVILPHSSDTQSANPNNPDERAKEQR